MVREPPGGVKDNPRGTPGGWQHEHGGRVGLRRTPDPDERQIPTAPARASRAEGGRHNGRVVDHPTSSGVHVRPARTGDVRAIRALVEPLARERVLVSKDAVAYYEGLQQFVVAEADDGTLAGCGALHVLWDDLAEVRTLAVAQQQLGHGVGSALLAALVQQARDLGVSRLFCLTFEVDFFARHGFEVIEGTPVTQEVFAELLRSYDEGVAEFLDLDRVKPNTLGNTRMLRSLIDNPSARSEPHTAPQPLTSPRRTIRRSSPGSR